MIHGYVGTLQSGAIGARCLEVRASSAGSSSAARSRRRICWPRIKGQGENQRRGSPFQQEGARRGAAHRGRRGVRKPLPTRSRSPLPRPAGGSPTCAARRASPIARSSPSGSCSAPSAWSLARARRRGCASNREAGAGKRARQRSGRGRAIRRVAAERARSRRTDFTRPLALVQHLRRELGSAPACPWGRAGSRPGDPRPAGSLAAAHARGSRFLEAYQMRFVSATGFTTRFAEFAQALPRKTKNSFVVEVAVHGSPYRT